MSWQHYILIVTLTVIPTLTRSQSLPEPLSLQAALDTAENESHYDILNLDHRIKALQAKLGVEAGEQGFRLDFEGRIREVGPSEASPSNDSGDNAASLILSRPVYDFGYSNAQTSVMEMQLESLLLERKITIGSRKLKILEQYFDVLNADNTFISENEALAIDFIRFDRARENQELGKISEIEVLRLQTRYETTRQRRHQSELQQRLTRAILAEAMGYPDQLPSELEIPAIDTERDIPLEFNAILQLAMQHNPEIRLAGFNSRVAQAAIKMADNEDGPSLELELEVSSYQRDSRLRDDWRAGLYLEVPLFTGSRSARRSQAVAYHGEVVSRELAVRSRIRLKILEFWQRLHQLKLEISGNLIEQDYRDRYLDRSRADYELEFRSDLGDSMVLFSRSHAKKMRAIYNFELTYQHLIAATGGTLNHD